VRIVQPRRQLLGIQVDYRPLLQLPLAGAGRVKPGVAQLDQGCARIALPGAIWRRSLEGSGYL
jgi:hypothetical protein